MAEEFVSLTTHETVPYVDTKIVPIVNKAVQSFEGQLSLSGESYSQYVVFEMDRYYDGIDLTSPDLFLQIAYVCANGTGDSCPAYNVSYSDEHVRFAWLVPPGAVRTPGILKVMPYAYGTVDGKEYILKTAYAEYTIHETINLESSIEEPTDNWYVQFLSQIQKVGNFADAIDTAMINAQTSTQNANDASDSALAARTYQQNADISASNAEAWAVGTRGGVAVATDDSTYHNNAKYWAQQAAASSGVGNLSLGIDPNDGLLYIYVNGAKQGTGISRNAVAG